MPTQFLTVPASSPNQANAQPIGGSVTDVKILVDGKVIQDPPGNQTTVTASFDALTLSTAKSLHPLLRAAGNLMAHGVSS